MVGRLFLSRQFSCPSVLFLWDADAVIVVCLANFSCKVTMHWRKVNTPCIDFQPLIRILFLWCGHVQSTKFSQKWRLTEDVLDIKGSGVTIWALQLSKIRVAEDVWITWKEFNSSEARFNDFCRPLKIRIHSYCRYVSLWNDAHRIICHQFWKNMSTFILQKACTR